ncbi:fiber [Murine adenovirus 2]|uniref:Fiber n=1 Tax=Murine adenovirus 2 TaxID=931972 RepID=E7CH51_9ADEN|nr:fiber [Murine adenovirus 2]ADR77852.1 fiber [Murine adenovirus 2]
MLALCSRKRRRRETEEDARRPTSQWEWRAVEADNFDPVYPFLPPPTPGSDTVLPVPVPPFFSDWDFYLSNLTVLNIRTAAPIIHTRNGLALNLGSGLKIENNQLVADGGGGGGGGGPTYTGTAPIQVDAAANTISLNVGSGLQVINGALQTRQMTVAPPLNMVGDLLYIGLGSGFKYNTRRGVDVYLGTGLRFNSAGAIEVVGQGPASLTVQSPLNKTGDELSLGFDNQYFQVGNDKLQIKLAAPLAADTTSGVKLQIGQNLNLDSQGALQVQLPSFQNPLTLSGTGSSQTVALQLAEPLTTSGNALSLSYESPLTITDGKLSLNVEDPLSQGTNGLELRLGAGLKKDDTGALAVDIVPPPATSITAESPLQLQNNVLSLRTDPGFLVDNTTHELKLNVGQPLEFVGSTGLHLNTDTSLQVNADGKLAVKAQSPLSITDAGLALNLGAGLSVVDNALTSAQSTFQAPLTVTDQGVSLQTETYFNSNAGKLGVNLGPGLMKKTPTGGGSQLAVSAGGGLSFNAANFLQANVAAPFHILDNKIALQYESPLTVIDDQNLSVTVEDPLALGDNGIILRLGRGLALDNNGALTAQGASFFTAAPLSYNTGNSTISLDYRSPQLRVSGGALALTSPVFVYQTPFNTPMRLRNGTYNEYADAHIQMVRFGTTVLFNIDVTGETNATGTQTWELQFDGTLGSCLTGRMQVMGGTGEELDVTPTFILPTSDKSVYKQGFMPIVCSENGEFKQSTYCSYALTYRLGNFYITLKSTTSGCKPIFQMSFMYESQIGIV